MEGTLTWGMAINQFATATNQTWGSISQSLATNLAKMTDETVNWGEVVKQMGIQVLTNLITVFLGLATQWAISLATQMTATTAAAAQTTAHVAMESAMTAATTAGATARLGISMATNKAIMAGTISSLGAVGAVGTAAMAVMGAVVATTSGIMAGIGAALVAGIVTAPLGAAVLAASATLLTAGTAAVAAGTAALQVALGTAVVAATTALALPLASGGIVTGPTVGLMGEAGSPEAAIPLNDRGAKFMQQTMGLGGGGTQTIYLQIDSRTLAKAVVPKMHDVVHLKLGYT